MASAANWRKLAPSSSSDSLERSPISGTVGPASGRARAPPGRATVGASTFGSSVIGNATSVPRALNQRWISRST